MKVKEKHNRFSESLLQQLADDQGDKSYWANCNDFWQRNKNKDESELNIKQLDWIAKIERDVIEEAK